MELPITETGRTPEEEVLSLSSVYVKFEMSINYSDGDVRLVARYLGLKSRAEFWATDMNLVRYHSQPWVWIEITGGTNGDETPHRRNLRNFSVKKLR